MLNRYQAVFKSLHSNNVRYLVMGEIAAILHGVPRATFDLDIIIEPSSENAEKLLKALIDAGMRTAELTSVDDLLSHEITIFKDYILLDVQTRNPGVDFLSAYKDKRIMFVGGQEFYVMSRTHLIKSKRAAGRPIDLQDAEALEGLDNF